MIGKDEQKSLKKDHVNYMQFSYSTCLFNDLCPPWPTMDATILQCIPQFSAEVSKISPE